MRSSSPYYCSPRRCDLSRRLIIVIVRSLSVNLEKGAVGELRLLRATDGADGTNRFCARRAFQRLLDRRSRVLGSLWGRFCGRATTLPARRFAPLSRSASCQIFVPKRRGRRRCAKSIGESETFPAVVPLSLIGGGEVLLHISWLVVGQMKKREVDFQRVIGHRRRSHDVTNYSTVDARDIKKLLPLFPLFEAALSLHQSP